MAPILQDDKTASVTVAPVNSEIGAVVEGVRLSRDLPPKVVDAIKAALFRHRVIFFRDQHHLDGREQELFAARLGPVEAYANAPALEGTENIWSMNSDDGIRANSWHTDVTFAQRVPAASVLRAVTLPPQGGDTLWASTMAAYAFLPEPLKLLAENLRAVHANFGPPPTRTTSKGYKLPPDFVPELFQAEHPVVHVHPVTGERGLILGHHLRHFVGLEVPDSFTVYQLLQNYVTRPEHCVRWQWRPGDVAIWDNFSTQHYASADYSATRLMHRVTLEGHVPVGVDGRPSVSQNDRVPLRLTRTS